MDVKEIVDAMQQIVGATSMASAADDMAPHFIDWRKRHTGTSACVVFPRKTEDVAKVLVFCNDHGIKVFPQGGNTSTCGGSVPDEDGNSIVLNLAKMNQIIEVNAQNNSMTVQAGCILADVQTAADQVDRLFPLTLGAEGSCQIGGNLATNAGGTNVVRFGNARDLVLGIEAVLPDGRIWNGLRTLRKNNSGYDLKHLFIGAEGTLGIITAASLKLFPRPCARATAILGFANVQHAVDEGIKLQMQFPGELVALELISKSEFDISLRHAAQTRNPFEATPEWIVLVELAATSGTSEAWTDRMTDYLRAAFEDSIILDAVVAASEQQRADFWKIRHSITESNVREGMGITHDIAVPTYCIPAFIQQAGKALERHFPEAVPVVVGHMGDGNLHYIAMFSHDYWAQLADHRKTQLKLSHLLYDISAAMGGTFSAEHGIGSLHVPEMSIYKDPVEIGLMHSVKALLDPHDTMNPGRVLPRP